MRWIDAAMVSKSSGANDRRSITSRLQSCCCSAVSALDRAVLTRFPYVTTVTSVPDRRTIACPIGGSGRLVSTIPRPW
ncbi:Uncharacterised protein [Mycobacterium tuberculosis]|nr:Uncharacterised protein [Mycobacterium tuberculosis]